MKAPIVSENLVDRAFERICDWGIVCAADISTHFGVGATTAMDVIHELFKHGAIRRAAQDRHYVPAMTQDQWKQRREAQRSTTKGPTT